MEKQKSNIPQPKYESSKRIAELFAQIEQDSEEEVVFQPKKVSAAKPKAKAIPKTTSKTVTKPKKKIELPKFEKTVKETLSKRESAEPKAAEKKAIEQKPIESKLAEKMAIKSKPVEPELAEKKTVELSSEKESKGAKQKPNKQKLAKKKTVKPDRKVLYVILGVIAAVVLMAVIGIAVFGGKKNTHDAVPSQTNVNGQDDHSTDVLFVETEAQTEREEPLSALTESIETEELDMQETELLPETETETEEVQTELLPTPPAIDPQSWEFLLANAEHPIDTYAPETIEMEGVPVDYRIEAPLVEFIAAARAEGLPVYLSSGYRDYYTQEYLYQRKIGQGYSPEEAATIVAKPGTSEHQSGLACDITDVYRETKNAELESTPTYQWMSAHCAEYGFIVRFPNDKSDITGIIYEPWHFRYVGKEAAAYMVENNLCLEEFLALYE